MMDRMRLLEEEDEEEADVVVAECMVDEEDLSLCSRERAPLPPDLFDAARRREAGFVCRRAARLLSTAVAFAVPRAVDPPRGIC